MFDVYVYDFHSGELVGVDPGYYTVVLAHTAAQRWVDRGMTVKIVDLEDGAVVYTLG